MPRRRGRPGALTLSLRRRELGLDTSEQNENNVLHMFMEAVMLKVFVEEAAALASVTLFIGMVAVWAQVIPQL